jgi:hypothetical protein
MRCINVFYIILLCIMLSNTHNNYNDTGEYYDYRLWANTVIASNNCLSDVKNRGRKWKSKERLTTKSDADKPSEKNETRPAIT